MDDKKILDELGEFLIDNVRDRVIKLNDLIMTDQMNSLENQQLFALLEHLDLKTKEIIKKYVLKTVDSTLHQFLWILEQYEGYDLIRYLDEEKKSYVSLRDMSDGLCGELYTEDGWIEKYSKYPPSIK